MNANYTAARADILYAAAVQAAIAAAQRHYDEPGWSPDTDRGREIALSAARKMLENPDAAYDAAMDAMEYLCG